MKNFLNKFQKKEIQEYPNSVNDKPVVSVSVLTFQHKEYIEECLDGILMQQTTFPFEILLGEDDSTDGTRDICLQYAKKYPDKIRLFLHHKANKIKINGNLTGRFNVIYNYYSARGKYIALCEGDDYWTDPLKLQKQVDFLEPNEDYALCLHNVKELNGLASTNSTIPNVKKNKDLSIEDYILNNKTATCSILFRKSKLGLLPEWFTQLSFGDLGLILILLKNSNGRARILADVMGVYRVHEGGIHGSFRKNEDGLVKAYEQHLLFNEMIKTRLFNNEGYEKLFNQKYYNTYQILSKLYRDQNSLLKFLKSKILMGFYKISKY